VAHLELVDLAKRYGEVAAVDGVSLAIARGERVALLGPSGCGKTTTLNLVAGFLTPDRGEIRIAGRDVARVPAHRRNTGMVFQSYALFPHLTVAENVAFGLRMRRVDRPDRARRVSEALALVRLEGLGDRYPRQLSGGQQQRVALARALVIHPEILLLDEPLSNLDAKLRQEMRVELVGILRAVGITTIFVTHDQEEALVLSDRIAVMSDGVIEQLGDPRAIYASPVNRFVADFIGESNLLRARTDATGEQAVLDSGATVGLPARRSLNAEVGLLIRPEAIELARAPASADGFAGTVEEVVYLGGTLKYFVRLDSGAVVIARRSFGQQPVFAAGERVIASWSPADVHVVQW
jgi:putative spermidine/putrescine transport system ATP-binding protein